MVQKGYSKTGVCRDTIQAIVKESGCHTVRFSGFLQGINEPHQFFSSVRNCDIVVLALSPFFGEIVGKDGVPMADIFCGVEYGVSQVSGASLFHMGIAVFKLAGLIGGW